MRCGGFVPRRRLAYVVRELSPRGSTEWGGPESNGHFGVWSSAGYRCRHRPGGPRARVERASRGPQPRVLTVERPRPLRAENAGDLRSRWGDSNTQRLAYRASAESGSGVSGITAKT